MRRWNGWGSTDHDYPVPELARQYLEQSVGPGLNLIDSKLDQILDQIPASAMEGIAGRDFPESLVTTSPYERLCHARGQSLPDWIALRAGEPGLIPDTIAYPATIAEIQALLDFAARNNILVIPYGGGTSVVGHINPVTEGATHLTIDLGRMNRLLTFDQTSHLATFEAGVAGPDLEAQLGRLGYTLGHFPQSFELSTLGGWIATRSSGQQSIHYGRIEDLFAGGHLETPLGPLDLPCLPASAAGPDLRHLILGSEGRFGIITSATVRVQRIPEHDLFYGAFFHDWEAGIQAVRAIRQEGIRASMLRLSDALETETTLILSGKERLANLARYGLGFLGYDTSRSMLIYAVTGEHSKASDTYRRINAVIRRYEGLPTGQTIGRQWVKSRFHTPYLRNSLWEIGYALDTVETAVPWREVETLMPAIQSALRESLADFQERLLVFSHLSHIYPDGASIYTTFIFRRAADHHETLARWQALKSAVSQAIIAQQGTISHQHGVGADHAPYLQAEKGSIGMDMLTAISHTVDPQQILNPHKLIP